jgi:GT2 family glycosyltransferase
MIPLFSVIIPTYNRAALLRVALASVAAQRFGEYEVVVVDDGSSDGSPGVARQAGPKVRLLEQPNRGPGAARNLGMRSATGEYLAFLDSDDVWFPWTLETYSSVIRDAGSPSFLAAKPLRFREEAELARVQEQPASFHAFRDYLASGDEWRWWGVSSFVMRRDAVAACGGFAEENMNGEDADLALKLGTAPGFVQITQPATFGYREHAANVTENLAKNLAGLWHSIRTERAGGYPGGPERARERWRILTRHARPMILACLREGRVSEGWRMYRATFRWHAATGRWKFILGFPLQALTRPAQPASTIQKTASSL